MTVKIKPNDLNNNRTFDSFNDKDKCVKCGKPVWKGNKYHRNFWKLYCEECEGK